MINVFQKRLCRECLKGGFGVKGVAACVGCEALNQNKPMPLGGSTCLVSVHATIDQHIEKLERFATQVSAQDGRDRALKILRVLSANIFVDSMPSNATDVFGPNGSLCQKKIFPSQTANGACAMATPTPSTPILPT